MLSFITVASEQFSDFGIVFIVNLEHVFDC